MEGFVATEKQKHGERSEPCKRGPLPKDASRLERMKRKLKTKVGAAVYARRKCIVEPVLRGDQAGPYSGSFSCGGWRKYEASGL